MSAGDAAALVLLGVAGFMAWQRQGIAAPLAASQVQITPETANTFANNAIQAALVGAGLMGATSQPSNMPPQPTPWTEAAQNAVQGSVLGAGLIGANFNINQGNEAAAVKTGYYSPAQVKVLMRRLVNTYGFAVDVNMAVAMCIVESGSVSFPQNGCNPSARRYEPALGEASAGLMQVLPSTAKWLATDMGYRAKGVPTEASLFNAETGAYFGLAYIDYLHRYKGKAQSDSFVVQGYNAGPTHSAPAYLAKYNTARAWVDKNLGA